MPSTEIMFKLPLSLIPFLQTPLPCPALGGAFYKQRLDCGVRVLRKIHVLWIQRNVGSNLHPLTICKGLEQVVPVLWTPLPYLEIRKNVSQDGTNYKIRQVMAYKSLALRWSIISTSPFFCCLRSVGQGSTFIFTSCILYDIHQLP